jgi:hypothetical protein
MAYQPMIDPYTGEVDTLAIAQRAPLRAAAEYGSPNYPPSYLRDATALADRARRCRTAGMEAQSSAAR